MRILIHTDEYYPTAQACSYRMRTMADAFIDQGDEVVVIASSTNKGKYSSDRDTLRVECKSAVFHADFLLLRLSRFGNSTGLDASS